MNARDLTRSRARAEDTAAVVAALTRDFGARAKTANAIREQHGHGEGLADPALPDVVVYPHTNEEVAAIVRALPRGAHSGHRIRRRDLARRSRRRAVRWGVRRPVGNEPRARDQCSGSRLPRAGGRDPRAGQRRAQGHRPVLSDRPGRQRDDRRHGVDPRVGHERCALRDHARERARAHRRDVRRPHHPHRRPRAKIVGGVRPHASFRRRRRHARHHHRNPAAPVRHSRSGVGGGVPVSRSQGRGEHRHPRDADGHPGGQNRDPRRAADAGLHQLLEARRLRGEADASLRVPRHRARRARAGGDDAGDRRRAGRQRVPVGDAARRPLAIVEGPAQRVLRRAFAVARQAGLLHRCLRADLAPRRLPPRNARGPRPRGRHRAHRRPRRRRQFPRPRAVRSGEPGRAREGRRHRAPREHARHRDGRHLHRRARRGHAQARRARGRARRSGRPHEASSSARSTRSTS